MNSEKLALQQQKAALQKQLLDAAKSKAPPPQTNANGKIVNAFGQEEAGIPKWQQKAAALKDMYANASTTADSSHEQRILAQLEARKRARAADSAGSAANRPPPSAVWQEDDRPPKRSRVITPYDPQSKRPLTRQSYCNSITEPTPSPHFNPSDPQLHILNRMPRTQTAARATVTEGPRRRRTRSPKKTRRRTRTGRRTRNQRRRRRTRANTPEITADESRPLGLRAQAWCPICFWV
mmetsp:Transcript_30397/g.47618  ORF Transcript_30397/g.47618 Transcript_30397/m.47618 type:complete len:237 (+) Transcript_30397:136-846(+)